MDDVATFSPTDDEATYSPFVLTMGAPEQDIPVGTALELHEDGRITVDWPRLELYARLTPVDFEHCLHRDFPLGCMVRALLAMRDGRVNVMENGDG